MLVMEGWEKKDSTIQIYNRLDEKQKIQVAESSGKGGSTSYLIIGWTFLTGLNKI